MESQGNVAYSKNKKMQ